MRITTRTCTVWDIVPIGRTVWLLALALGAFMVRAVCAFPAHAAESQLPAAEMSKEALATVASRAGQMGTINNIEAVASTAGAAAVALNPHTVAVPEREANAPVTMWVAHGNFDDTLAKTPPSAKTPTGTVVAFILNQEEQVAAIYVGNTAPALSSLGSPEDFSSPTDSAIVARAAHVLPKPPKDRAIVARAAHRLPRPSRVRAHAATWGNNCKVAEQHHCYYVSEWIGSSSEEIEGSWEQQDTTALDVPDSSAGDFVDMEQWVLMDSSGTKWMESGQQGGEYKGCCELWWFWATEYGGKYTAYVDAPYVWAVAKNHWNNYTLKSTTPTEGIWCNYVGEADPGTEQHYCFNGWPVYSKGVEAGAEVADEEMPSFSAKQLMAQQHVGYNGLEEGWFGWPYGERYNSSSPELCGGYTGPTPGDIYYGTC